VDHVLPATQDGTASQASEVAFHVKPGALQAQLVWPVRVLLVLYSSVTGHERHVVAPLVASITVENFPAGHAAQIVLASKPQAVLINSPAVHEEHVAHGDHPCALHVEPSTQEITGRHINDV